MRRRAALTCLVLMVVVSGAGPLHGFGDPERESWQPPQEIMDAVGVRPGMRIGEAGAGRGYLTFHLAERVGKDGIVFANDIDEDSLATIRRHAGQAGVENVVTVLGEVTDPLFPEKNLDMVVMVYVLHCLERPIEFMETLRDYLKQGAPVVIVERNTDQDRGHYPMFMSNRQILETISSSGYKLEKTETFLPRDTIYIYRLTD